MGNAFIHCREQLPVGQGFFHFAEFWYSPDHERDVTNVGRDTSNFTYVYDCGSTKRYSGELIREICALKRRIMPKPLTVLFVSHFHYDHISGIQELLKDLKVNTVVMPLVEDVERLIVYAKSISQPDRGENEIGDATFEKYQEFIADPVEMIRNQSKNSRIILVENASEDDVSADGVPRRDDDGEDLKDDGDRDLLWWRSFRGNGETQWKPVGEEFGSLECIREKLPFGFQVGAKTSFQWLLLPFVDPIFKKSKNREEFVIALSKCLNIEKQQTEAMIRSKEDRLKLLKSHSDCLKTTYKTISKDLNLTTLSLFSGPSSSIGLWSHVVRGCRWDHCCGCPVDKVAWLGTGDANLKCDRARSSFLKYFGSRLSNVLTMTLPHHGSENSFHPDLLNRVQPCYCVVAADQNSNWRHPASSVTQAVFSAGLRLHVTTSAEKSVFKETVVLCCK